MKLSCVLLFLRYGCWYLSFAVVAKGWAEESFPNNVPVSKGLLVSVSLPI